MSSTVASKVPLDNVKDILSFNDQVLTKDNRIIGKLDKDSEIYKLLLKKPIIEKACMYRHRGVTHMVWFPTGDQILFGNLRLDNNVWLEFRIRGIKYNRDHDPCRSYTHLLK